jgi:hypothetical protein
MSLRLPSDLWRAVLEPVGQSHVTVCKVKHIVAPHLRSDGILLRKHKTHDFAEFDVVEEELDVNLIRRVFRWSVDFVVDEVVGADHFNIGILYVNRNWATQRHGDRSISREQCPPDPLPETLICFAEL